MVKIEKQEKIVDGPLSIKPDHFPPFISTIFFADVGENEKSFSNLHKNT